MTELHIDPGIDSDPNFRFDPGTQVSMRVLDPEGNVVWQGYGRVELEMVSQIGEEADDGGD